VAKSAFKILYAGRDAAKGMTGNTCPVSPSNQLFFFWVKNQQKVTLNLKFAN
jgi:hypothetical protein